MVNKAKKSFKTLLKASLILLLLSFLGVYVFCSSHQEVFPKLNGVNYNYGSYHEDIEADWSEITLDSSNHSFKMTYTLSRGTRTPFVAAFIEKDSGTSHLAKFHEHNTLKIELKSKVGMRIPVMLGLDYKKGETKKNGKSFPMVTLVKFIEYNKAGVYEIPLDEMQIPDWWYRVHRLHRDEVDFNKIESVRSIIVGSCSILKEKIEDTIEVKSVAFYSNNTSVYIRIFLSLLAGLLLAFASLFLLQYKRAE